MMLKRNQLLILIKLVFNELNWLKLKGKIKKIKLLVMDVDGVLTDGKL